MKFGRSQAARQKAAASCVVSDSDTAQDAYISTPRLTQPFDAPGDFPALCRMSGRLLVSPLAPAPKGEAGGRKVKSPPGRRPVHAVSASRFSRGEKIP